MTDYEPIEPVASLPAGAGVVRVRIRTLEVEDGGQRYIMATELGSPKNVVYRRGDMARSRAIGEVVENAVRRLRCLLERAVRLEIEIE